jgi:hypothetical protein
LIIEYDDVVVALAIEEFQHSNDSGAFHEIATAGHIVMKCGIYFIAASRGVVATPMFLTLQTSC